MPRYFYSKKHAIQLLVSVGLFLVLSACGDSSHQSRTQDQNSQRQTVTGNAVKGIIANGIIRAYQANSETNLLLTQTRTNALGEFTLSLPASSQLAEDTVILLELTSDQNSTMICDLVSGCELSPGAPGNSLVNFGEHMPLPPGFTLLGTIANNTQEAYISPLSHITITTAKSLPGGLTRQNIGIAAGWLAQTFGLEQDLLTIETPDLTTLSSLNELSDQQLKQAILSASFYPLVSTESWRTGAINLDTLPLEDIFYLAAELAQQLADQQDGTQNTYASILSAISDDAQNSYLQLVSSPLVFTEHPSSISVNEGDSFLLHVLVTGEGSYSYQWRKDGVGIPGATSASYGSSASLLDDMGSYNVLVSNTIETIESLHALVTVNQVIEPVVITQHPQSITLTEGDGFSLNVIVDGSGPFEYQWQKGGSIIPGASSGSYAIGVSNLGDAGSYRVVVRNEVSEVTSNLANVIITETVSPITIILQPQPVTVVLGMSATFRVEASGGGFISYQWHKDDNDINNIFTDTLNISAASMSDAGSYSVTVTNSQGSLTSTAATLTVLADQVPVSITLHPQSTTVLEGENASLNVTANGDGVLQYQWHLNGNDIIGATQSNYVISSAGLLDTGAYTVTVQNEYSSETSLTALITVNAPASIALSWDIPTQREDGSTLELFEIAGYVIEYGADAGNLSGRITITDGGSSQYQITDQNPGTLYVRIATVDSDGIQGNFSALLAVTIP